MKLTIAASNKDRLQIDHNVSDFFIKSLQWQTCTDFEVLIADGGSQNYNEIKDYLENFDGPVPMRIVQHRISDDHFQRALLNNVGVRNANGEYVMTTDVDMLYGKDFVKTLLEHVAEDTFIESRTMYLKSHNTRRIYEGEWDPYNDLDGIKHDRIKKRTTAGGCQCMHRDRWSFFRGFDETFVGWGSEDMNLYNRVKMTDMKIVWLGETREELMLFHQAHPKKDPKKDLEEQSQNKKRLRRASEPTVNPDGWGGIKD